MHGALSVLVAGLLILGGSHEGPGHRAPSHTAAQQDPPSYARIAANDFARMESRVARIAEQNWTQQVTDCGARVFRCTAIKNSRQDIEYAGRLFNRGSYLAVRPGELEFAGTPYVAWVPLEAVQDGANVVEQWQSLATRDEPSVCNAAACLQLILQPPNDRHREPVLSECEIEPGGGPPRRCDIVVILGSRTWVKATVGWGNPRIAAELGSVGINEEYETDRSLSLLQLPSGRGSDILAALARALASDPLSLDTELKPPVEPRHVTGKRSGGDSKVLAGLREWSTVRVELFPAVQAADRTMLSSLQVTTTLWVSRTASNRPSRPAEASESLRYQGAVLGRVVAELERLCNAKVLGDRVVCTT